MKKLLFAGSLFMLWVAGFSQTTYQRVYNILQANCTGACHTSSTPNNLVLSGTEQQVYSALVDMNPVNATALANGYKLVDPGNTRNSYLFAKINHGLDANLSLKAGEGSAMPDSATALTQVEREMVRQWIVFGAHDTGVFADEATITGFYVGQGGQPRLASLAPPAPNEGIQIYWGPMFVVPGIEIQHDINTYIKNTTTIDISKFVSKDNEESHHFAIFKFLPGKDSLFAKGMHAESSLGDVAALWYNAELISQYPNDMTMEFPAGTGMVWEPNTVLKLSYHMINYNDSILMAEGYLNLYFTPHQTATIPVKTAQVVYGYPNPYGLVVPNNNQDTTFTINQYGNDSAFLWNIISIQAHTHKYGTDYNLWQRNADGTKGDMIYDGSYNSGYTFDQGVYVWNDPPYRVFNPLLQVDMRKGLIHEATYKNNTNHTVNFGISTEDEMFITFIMYYKSELTSSAENVYADDNLKIYPNPVSDYAYVKIADEAELKDAAFKLYDMLGRPVAGVEGITDRYFRIDLTQLPSGTYIYRLSNNKQFTGSGKIVVQH